MVSSSLFGVSRAVQEFGLARFKSNVAKSTKGFEYVLARRLASIVTFSGRYWVSLSPGVTVTQVSPSRRVHPTDHIVPAGRGCHPLLL